MNLLHLEDRYMHTCWPFMTIPKWWSHTMPTPQTRKSKKNFYTNGWQMNWVWQHPFLKLHQIQSLRQNPILQNYNTGKSPTQATKTFSVVYRNCSTINAVLFAWGKGVYCKFKFSLWQIFFLIFVKVHPACVYEMFACAKTNFF